MSTPVTSSAQPPALDRARWFSEEVQPHEPALRHYLRCRVPSATDIDDVVQDSYLKILAAAPARKIESVKAYLFTVARNTAWKLFRKQRIYAPIALGELPETDVVDSTPDAAAAAEAESQDALVAQVIAELPGRCREILLLHVADGCSPIEIARRLDLAETTVRTQLARGIEKCRNRLRALGEGGNT